MLDGEQVVRFLVLHDEPGGLPLGVQRVSQDDRPGQVRVPQQRSERGDLVALRIHPLLGDHRGLGAGDRGQEVRGSAAGPPGAAGGLAVHRDHHFLAAGLLAAVPGRGQQPRADLRIQRVRVHLVQGPADRGLARHHQAPAARVPPHPESRQHLRGRRHGPFRDRRQRLRSRRDRRARQRQDRRQLVAAPPDPPPVRHPAQENQQATVAGIIAAGRSILQPRGQDIDHRTGRIRGGHGRLAFHRGLLITCSQTPLDLGRPRLRLKHDTPHQPNRCKRIPRVTRQTAAAPISRRSLFET